MLPIVRQVKLPGIVALLHDADHALVAHDPGQLLGGQVTLASARGEKRGITPPG